MEQKLSIGVIGEFHPDRPSHHATNDALNHAADRLSMNIDVTWLQTKPLENDLDAVNLANFDALWCAPGGFYESKIGAMKAIQFAREKDWPFIGT